MKTHTIRVKDGKSHHAIDTDCAEFKDRFLVYIYVDERGDPTAVRLLDSWQGEAPCPTTTSGAKSAGTYGTENRSALLSDGQPTTTETLSRSAVAAPSAPPLTEEPEVVKHIRWMVEEERGEFWSTFAPRLKAMLAAYDAERTHHDRTTRTLQTERAALTIARAKLARIIAILSDARIEHPQAIGRALRVAEGQA